MKAIFLLSLSMINLFANSIEHLTINNHDFSFVKEHYRLYDTKGDIVKIYNDKNLIITFTIWESTGGCSSKAITEGTYEISDNKITFYTMWHRQGKAYLAPYGAKIAHYKVSKFGKLELIDAQIYIEETAKGYDDESGMEYLFNKPKTVEQQEQLANYIKEVEEEYNATFVFNKDALIKEVKEALKRKIKAIWRR